MNVLFVTPECAPLTKTGGLGDVSEALPAALRALGHDVRVLVPGYPPVLEKTKSKEVRRLDVLGLELKILESEGFFILDCPELYRREGGPYQDAAGADWRDNPVRFGVLCKAAAMMGAIWPHEVVHSNDWPCGLVPVFLGRQGPRTVMTVHNVAFQGSFDASYVARLGLPPGSFGMDGVEFHGAMSFLKGGLAFADAITTVSPTYAREIQTGALGFGMDGLLRHRAPVLTGILNGIDTAAWDPSTDQRIARRYTSQNLDEKTFNKTALQERMGLGKEDVPLLGVVSRLTWQKGTDLVAAAAEELLALPAQLAVLGSGNQDHQEALLSLERKFKGKIAVKIGFDEDLAHLIEAGADLFLMPSRYEPCGLNQMYSQRYGTPPVARATGGLVDTIADGETGFLFGPAEPAALAAAVRRAVGLRRELLRWRALQRAGMQRDFGWAASAKRYAELYARLAVDRPAAVP